MALNSSARGNIAASQTDAEIVAAIPGRRIRVTAVAFVCGATATNATFNSKGSGAGSPVSCLFANAANGGAVLGFHERGWFETELGEALTLTTGPGSTTGLIVTYAKA